MEKRTGNTARHKGKLARKIALLSLLAVLGFTLLVANWWPSSTRATAEAADPKVLTQEQWRSRLASDQPLERAQAVLALAPAHDPEDVPRLRRLLDQDPAPNVKAVAALVLADWQDRASTTAIVRLLQAESQVDTHIVLDALSRMGDPRAAEAALPFLDSDEDVLRLQAVDALVRMQGVSWAERVLRQAQLNVDPQKARTYAMALGKLAYADADDYLLNLARETGPTPTRWASYLALGRIGSVQAVPLLVKAMSEPHAKGRENAQQALVAIGSPKAAPLLWPLLAHGERSVRFAASDVLVGLDHPMSNRELINALDNETSSAPAALALGRRKVASAWEPVHAALSVPGHSEREVLAQALGWLGDDRSVPLLRRVLAEAEGNGRHGAAWSLGILRAREARGDLQQVAHSEDNRLAQLALDALGQLGDPASTEFLAAHASSSPAHASASLAALAQIEGDAPRLHLQRLAAHHDERISRAALQALAQRGDAAAVPTLVKLFDEVDAETRISVQQALVAITGKHWSTPQQWQRWHEAQPR